MKTIRLSPAQIARSIVVVLVLLSIQIISGPTLLNSAPAYTQGTVTNGTSYGGTGGGPNGANQNCTNGAVVAIGATKSGDNLNAFMFVCKTINNDATLSATEATTNVFNTPAESDRCASGQIGIGVRVIASNGGSLVGGVGLICGNLMSQGNSDTRSIMPNASSAGTVYTYTCGAGQLLAGFYLRTGALVDQLTPKCSTFTGFSYGAVGAPTAIVTGNTASVSFAAVTGSIADTALTYSVSAVPNSGNTITVTGSSSPISVPNLVARATYTITVTASNTYGTSASTSSASAAVIVPGGDTDTALSLNGSTQYAEVADTTGSVFDTTGTITMEAWVYATSDCTGDQAIISKLNSYMMYCGGGGYIRYVFDADGAAWGGTSSSVKLVKNEWHHIAFTKTSTSSNVLIYLDGFLAQTVNAGPTTMTPNNDAFSIGRYNGSYNFQGQIDEVRIYNSQRTQAQIQADMNTYGPLTDSDLVVYYDFNEGTGTTLFNRDPGSPLSSDLTIYGSPTWDSSLIAPRTSYGPYAVQTFNRTYLTSSGGWKIPSDAKQINYLVVAGGGAGGGSLMESHYAGGGGGAGGLRTSVTTVATGYLTPIIGQGQLSLGCVSTRGYNSSLSGGGITAVTATGGGSGSCNSSTVDGGGGIIGNSGGSGGGGGAQVYAKTAGAGNAGAFTPAEGFDGGAAQPDAYSSAYQSGGGGGGAAAAGVAGTASRAGNGGAGLASTILDGTTRYYGGGGGGGIRPSGPTLSTGGTGGGGAGGSTAATSGTANTGGGGGGCSYKICGSGGSGIIIIRWITASVPIYTKPTNAYLNVGMTETFTTNVAQDSATAILTRTFRWESTTPSANGVYTLIKQGTGAANAAFSWVPTDTTTSGSGYLYRLIVTDSDTAGLFITDSSTAFAIINRALSVVGTSTITKRINLSKNETFTITLGTSTYRPTLSPVIPGITLDTSTAGLAIIKIADTVTVGTYYETLTVIDSVSASVVTPLIIKVAAPPTLLNSGEIVSDGLVLNLDAGNSASLIADSGTVTTAFTWNDLSGSKANAATGAGVNTGGLYGTTCTAPKYTSENGGALTFTANSTNCYYASGFTGNNLINNYSIEAWFRTSATLPSGAGIVGQSVPNTSARSSIYIVNYSTSGLIVAFFDNVAGLERYANCPYVPTIGAWTHIAGTYDGTTMTTYINGASRCTATFSWTPNSSINTLGTLIGKGPAGGSDTAFPGSIATVRMYNKALTSAQILANFNATKNRFDNSNIAFLTPSKQYGATLLDSFTATSGLDTKTVTFSVGDRAGIDWDTTTVTNRINLTLQESLTVGTYLDTVTVTDSLGQSTYLPVVMTTTKADTLTVTIGTATTVTYNGSAITIYPRATVTGLKWTDTATSLTRFASTLYTETTTVPENADTYTVRGALPVFTVGSIDNYLGVIYETSTAVVNKAFQRPLNIFMYGGVVGSPYYIYLQGGSGTGLVTETLTGVATLTGCAINNHFLTAAEQKQGFCEVRVVKAGDQNYFSETQTVQLYFMAFIRNNPTNQSGSGSTIALNGQTSLTIDDSSTVRVPRITGFSKNGSTLTINGQGFGSSPVTVTFERYVDAAVAPTPTGGGTVITVTIPGSAISGPVLVITSGGRDSIDWLDLP